MTGRILVVDDERMVRLALRSILEPEGYHVLEAADGEIALRLYRKEEIDVVIIDVLMPERDGLETILQMRHLSPDAKIIAVSGGGQYGLLELLDVAKGLGARIALSKPFEKQELLAAVQELLADTPPE